MKVYEVSTTYIVRKHIVAEDEAEAIKKGIVDMYNFDDMAEIVVKRVDITGER